MVRSPLILKSCFFLLVLWEQCEGFVRRGARLAQVLLLSLCISPFILSSEKFPVSHTLQFATPWSLRSAVRFSPPCQRREGDGWGGASSGAAASEHSDPPGVDVSEGAAPPCINAWHRTDAAVQLGCSTSPAEGGNWHQKLWCWELCHCTWHGVMLTFPPAPA